MLAPPSDTSDTPHYELALVLSGGGARGLAHIGALQVIDEMHLPVDLVVGVSMGSIVGAGYAAGFTPDQMLDLARTMRVGSVFRPQPGRQSLADPAGLRDAIYGIFGDRTFADLERELAVVSASVLDGQPFVFRDGPLVDALVASCSIPLLFPPISHEGVFLLDGGLVNALPLALVRELGVRQIVAVDASSHVRHLLKLPFVRHVAQGVVRVLERRRDPADLSRLRIVSRILHHASQPLAPLPVEVLIRPSFGRLTTYHYQRWNDMVRRGRIAAEQARPALMALGQTDRASA